MLFSFYGLGQSDELFVVYFFVWCMFVFVVMLVFVVLLFHIDVRSSVICMHCIELNSFNVIRTSTATSTFLPNK